MPFSYFAMMIGAVLALGLVTVIIVMQFVSPEILPMALGSAAILLAVLRLAVGRSAKAQNAVDSED